MRPRVLLVGEAVTLAHVARPAALFRRIDPARWDVLLACDPRAHRFLDVPAQQRRAIHSLDPAVFADRLARGRPLLDSATLHGQVAEDLELFARERPDLVIGDFRLSLSVSARLAGVPYAAIANAYWSPYAADRRLPLPVLPWTRFAPLAPVSWMFSRAQSLLLAPHTRPINSVRLAHGLPSLGSDLRRVYTDADHTLYADSAELFPLVGAPPGHLHIGPLLWSPPGSRPDWWGDLAPDRPLVYVTMGSSGAAEELPRVLDLLAARPVIVLVATAGAALPPSRWPNARLADFLPGDEAAARASLVVCNGGSPTAQQALAHGVPVLGLCRNLDQMLNMQGLEAAGLGVSLRVDQLRGPRLAASIDGLLAGHPGGLGGAQRTFRPTLAFEDWLAGRYPAKAAVEPVCFVPDRMLPVHACDQRLC